MKQTHRRQPGAWRVGTLLVGILLVLTSVQPFVAAQPAPPAAPARKLWRMSA